MGHCVGTIVEMAPANHPRKIDAIISNLITYFRQNTKGFAVDKYGKPYPETSEYVKYPMMTLKQIKTLVDGITSIKEVEELNLSNNEYNAGIGVNDENRSKFHFVDRYSKDDDNDFIDLWALTRNTYVSMVDEILDFEERFDTKKGFN